MALVAAQQEATGLGHNTVEPEHLLLGLLGGAGLASATLAGMGISADDTRRVVARRRAPAPRSVASPPLGSRTKEAIDEANRERSTLGDEELSTAHLLLGLLGTGNAVEVLRELGGEPDALRAALIERRPWPAESGGPGLRAGLVQQQPAGAAGASPSVALAGVEPEASPAAGGAAHCPSCGTELTLQWRPVTATPEDPAGSSLGPLVLIAVRCAVCGVTLAVLPTPEARDGAGAMGWTGGG